MKKIFALLFLAGCGGSDPQPAAPDLGGVDSASDSGPGPCAGVVCDAPPRTACLDATTLRSYGKSGICAFGACSYLPTDVLCQNGCENGACKGNDPCAGVSCTNPPAASCKDAMTLHSWSASGTCAAGSCSYASLDTACANGCVNGACKGDPCAGITCNQPPSAYCVDTNTLRSYGAQGSCGNGHCGYTSSDSTCANGCASGACNGDPCAGVTCNHPPVAACLDANTRRSYSAAGLCNSGTCSYTPTDTSCAHGCSGGLCNADPCAGVTCNQPPASSCTNATTRRSYAASGTCSGGTCSYTPTDTPCPAPSHGAGVCSSGACDFTCNPGYMRLGSSCVVACTDACTAGSSQCTSGQVQTCISGASGCLEWSAPSSCANGCFDTHTCDPCHHECPAFGASCSGSVLSTCVLDDNNCRKLLTQTCSLGCSNGACTTCSSYAEPKLSSTLDDASGWYQELAWKDATTLFAGWQGRMNEYTEPNTGFSVVNATNPSALSGTKTQLSASDRTDDLQIVGSNMYFLDKAGLEIWDTTPKSVTTFALADTASVYKRSLSVSGTLACIAAEDGLHVVDLSGLSSTPKQVGLYTTDAVPYLVQCAGGLAALILNNKMQVVSLADPTHPAKLAELNPGDLEISEHTLQFDGSNIYALRYSLYDQQLYYSVEIYHYAANAITSVGSLGQIDGPVRGFKLSGTQLSIGIADSVGIIDVSNPAAPKWKKRFASDGADGTSFDGTTLWAAGNGVASYDPTRIPDVSLISANDYLGGAAMLGSLSVQARASGMVIADLRDPSAPVQMSKTAMNATDVVVVGSLAYVAVEESGNSALRIYDIKDPWKPLLIGSAAGTGGTWDGNYISQLHVSGTRAYALCGVGNICVWDVSNPANPSLYTASMVISQQTPQQSSTSVYAFDGRYLYLPTAQNLTIVDFQEPKTPVKVGSIAITGYSGTVAIDVAGKKAYLETQCHLVEGDECFFIIDVSTPSSPMQLGTAVHNRAFMKQPYTDVQTVYQNDAMRVIGNRMYFVNEWGGIVAYDVSDATNPKYLTEYWTPLPARHLFASDRFVTAHLFSDFPYPAPAAQEEQVIEMCH
jgi:hypothetical protein